MRVTIAIIFFVAAAPAIALAQSPSRHHPGSGRPGPTCAQILQTSSSDWGARSAIADSSADAKLHAIASYARCYDARTDRLAAALAKSGKGPSRAALEDFREFDTALKDFTARALAAADPPSDALKSAYAALYEKQFRYALYQECEQKGVKPQPHVAPAPPASKITQAPLAPASTSASPAPAATAQGSADTDPLTMAKNHFGEQLDALPEDKMHELHAAFGRVVGRYAVTNETRLAVYRYAIFLLEPPAAAPFAPPPF